MGKTVLLETFKPLAINQAWLWAGTDLSESTSISEENLAIRLLTDLSVVTTSIGTNKHVSKTAIRFPGGAPPASREIKLNYPTLQTIYDAANGLVSDKLKTVLEFVWPHLRAADKRGVVFAYDEAQNLSEHAKEKQYPLSLLLDVFQSLQRKNVRFLLALTGLPTLFPKLVEARTYSERMFHIVFLHPLAQAETYKAIEKPLKEFPLPIKPAPLKTIWQVTKGYPYFIQYVCRETFDVWVQAVNSGSAAGGIPVTGILACCPSISRLYKTASRSAELNDNPPSSPLFARLTLSPPIR